MAWGLWTWFVHVYAPKLEAVIWTNLWTNYSLMKVKSICWQRVFEDSRIIKSLLNKVILVIADGYTKELCIAAHLFTLQVVALGRKSGFLFVANCVRHLCNKLMGETPKPQSCCLFRYNSIEFQSLNSNPISLLGCSKRFTYSLSICLRTKNFYAFCRMFTVGIRTWGKRIT